MAGAVHHGGRPLFMTHGLTSRQPGRWTCCPYRRTVLLRPALGDVTVVAGRENRFFAETRQGGPGPGWRREHETVVFNSWAVAFRAPRGWRRPPHQLLLPHSTDGRHPQIQNSAKTAPGLLRVSGSLVQAHHRKERARCCSSLAAWAVVHL
jgi:hypothetical protein